MLEKDKCKGCTNCIKRCPVEAIRVHAGKAKIMEERCIDCGECIRCCPNHAKYAITDGLHMLSAYDYKIVMPAPSFFGQFREEVDVDTILSAFLALGFDEVFETALAAEVVSYMLHTYLETHSYKKPMISSACPAVLRLMQMKFPDLLQQVAPIMTPMEVAARLAKENAAKRTGIPYDRIGTFFISPCPAKVTEMKQPMHTGRSSVDGVIGASFIYKDLIKHLQTAADARKNLQKATGRGIAWGYVTGESRALGLPTTLSVGGIENAISVFEEVERGELREVDFIELQACVHGCVGGPLNVQNPFIARVALKKMVNKHLADKPFYSEQELKRFYEDKDFWATVPIQPRPIMMLDGDVSRALSKLERLEEIKKTLPGLDCGACGSPSCTALAEDIIRGIAFDTDCVIKLRERVKTLAGEILDLAKKMPTSMAVKKGKASRAEKGAGKPGNAGGGE